MRRAAAIEVDAIGVRIGALIAVRGVHHQEDALAGLELPAVEGLRLLDDAHLRADRPVVAQQLLDGGGRKRGVLAELLQLAGEAQERCEAIGNVVGRRLVAGEEEQDAHRDELVLRETIALLLQMLDQRDVLIHGRWFAHLPNRDLDLVRGSQQHA